MSRPVRPGEEARRITASGSWRELPLPDLFNQAAFLADRHLADGRADRTAYLYQGQRITYGELVGQTSRVGNALRSLGIDWEQRVALLLPDGPELISCYLGAMKIGAVPVPLNVDQSPAEIAHCLRDSRAKVVVVAREYLAKVEQERPRLPCLRFVLVVGRGWSEPGSATRGLEEVIAFDDLLMVSSDEMEAAPTSRDDMAFWMYSSGTTGLPKAVVHLHQDLLFYLPPVCEAVLGVTEDDVILSTSKLFFSYGRNATLEMPLLYGASAVLWPPRPRPEPVLETIARYRPTLLFSVPSFYSALLEHVRQTGRAGDLASLRLCVSSGEALPPALFEGWRETCGLEIVEVLGSTDAGAMYLANTPGQVKPGSAGRLLPGFGARLVDEQRHMVPPGEIGTLHLKSGGATPFFGPRRDSSRRTILGEWLDTGDRFYQDAGGFYWYAGRSDDLFKFRGMWVIPLEIEELLLRHPAVRECAVVGAVDEEGLLRPRAVVVLRPGYGPAAELSRELEEFLGGRLAPYKVPRHWEFVDELPRTATGKVQRFLLREESPSPSWHQGEDRGEGQPEVHPRT